MSLKEPACFFFQAGSGMYLEPGTVIRSVGNPVQEANMMMDPNFEIADLPVKLELRYVIESKMAAHGVECPKVDYRTKDLKNQQVFVCSFIFGHFFKSLKCHFLP